MMALKLTGPEFESGNLFDESFYTCKAAFVILQLDFVKIGSMLVDGLSRFLELLTPRS